MKVATSVSSYESLDSPKKFSFSKFPDGIPRGCLLEISGNKRSSLLEDFLHEQPEASLVWVVQGPPWVDAGIQDNVLDRKVTASLPRISLVDYEEKIAEFNTFSESETYWTLIQALRSRQFEIVVTPDMPDDVEKIKELRVFAELTGTVLIFMNEHPCLDWTMGVVLEAEGLWPGLRKSLSSFGRKRARTRRSNLKLLERII